MREAKFVTSSKMNEKTEASEGVRAAAVNSKDQNQVRSPDLSILRPLQRVMVTCSVPSMEPKLLTARF